MFVNSIEILFYADIIRIQLNATFAHIIAGIWPASFYRMTVNHLTMSEQWKGSLSCCLLKPQRALLHSIIEE